MRKLFILLSFILFGAVAVAQPNYSAELIPKHLLPYASAVIRDQDVRIEVKADDNTVYHIKSAMTVLNKNGDEMARVLVWHNKGNVIKTIKGVVYDEFGKPTEKFSESNFEDVNASDDLSLFEDSRVKHYRPSVVNYPYTVEYEYEVRSKQSLHFRDWEPNNSTGIAVEKSSFTFVCKPELNIRYKELNMPSQVVISNNKGSKIYTWTVSNLKAIREEPFSPNSLTYLSSVKIAPEQFSYEGIQGSFTNWAELGKWIYDKLLLGRGELSPQTVTHIKNITADISDPKQKARKIYEYMQGKTRYISVQIGIGGFQPFKAFEVDRTGYGDCKGLVNYMQALLKAVDIPSYYCVVQAGDEKTSLIPEFASMDQGNHIILCIPFKNDTTWLECTDQTKPFGYLGDFTDDRNVLACTENGGVLLRTPKYSHSKNVQIRNGSFMIKEDGELAGTMNTLFKGIQYENRESVILGAPIEQAKALARIYPINNLELEKFEFKQDKSPDPTTTENIKFKARDYASTINNKLNFLINAVNRTRRAPREVRNRANSVCITNGYTDEDEITFVLPQSYKLDKLPLSLNIEKPFGTYHASMTISDGQITYKRKIQLIDGTYKKELYQELVDFYQEVADADNYSVTLAKIN